MSDLRIDKLGLDPVRVFVGDRQIGLISDIRVISTTAGPSQVHVTLANNDPILMGLCSPELQEAARFDTLLLLRAGVLVSSPFASE